MTLYMMLLSALAYVFASTVALQGFHFISNQYILYNLWNFVLDGFQGSNSELPRI